MRNHRAGPSPGPNPPCPFSLRPLPPPLPVQPACHVRPHPTHRSLLQQHSGSSGHRHSPQYLLHISHQGEKVSKLLCLHTEIVISNLDILHLPSGSGISSQGSWVECCAWVIITTRCRRLTKGWSWMISRRVLRVSRQSEVRPHHLRLRLCHSHFYFRSLGPWSGRSRHYEGKTGHRPSLLMLLPHSLYSQDWLLVAAGIERFCFFVYTMAFALVTSVYI